MVSSLAVRRNGDVTPVAGIGSFVAHLPDFSADRNIIRAEWLAQAEADGPIARRASADVEKRCLQYRTIWSSQFEMISGSQVNVVGQRKGRRRGEEEVVLNLEDIADHDQLCWN
jgi:hypothetical protein